MSTADGSIDITVLVEQTREAFVSWGVGYLYALTIAIPNVGPFFALPIVSSIIQGFYKIVLDTLSKSAVMMGFFMNTVMRKATEADDFNKAADALANLPQDVSDADYAKAEQAKIDAFAAFVTFTG